MKSPGFDGWGRGLASPALHTAAVLTAVMAYALIVAGGLVHGTGASFACPDWPLCYGKALPSLERPVLIEVSHRAAAGLAGLSTFVLAVWLSRKRRQAPALARAGWAAAALVVFQGAWGAAATLLRFPTPLATLHNAVSLVFFLLLLYLAVGTAPSAMVRDRPEVLPAARQIVLVAGVVLIAQMVLGALVRYSGAAAACTDLPLCDGALWPQGVAAVHMLHRVGSVATTALVVIAAVAMFRSTAQRPGLRGLSATVILLVLAQGLLGARSVSSALNLPTVQAHIGVGVALLAAHWGLYLGSAPARTRAPVGVTAWVRDIVALTKPRVSGLVLATFGGGLALAPGEISRWRAVFAVVGTVLIVGAANAWNMFLESDFDRLMKRTRGRPLPQGRLPRDTALALGTLLAVIAVPLLALGANGLTALLGLFAFASYVFAYTPLKQKSTASLYVGAVPGAMPPLMGWTAVTGNLDAPGLALFAVLFLWQIPHFLAIALFRTDEYAGAGFKVMPAVHGPHASRVCAVVFAVATMAASLTLQPLGVAGWTYTVTASLLGAGFVAWGVAGLLPGRGPRWARGYFAASLLYLVALFVALTLDRWV